MTVRPWRFRPDNAALKTVRDFENKRRQSLTIVRVSIRQAFEQPGIEFFDDDGLRLKKKMNFAGLRGGR